MGMAASQARLLTITARLADNELRSQTINNAKMRLATQSSQASQNYINALNNATLKFSNYDSAGNALTQDLSYNALTAYSSYNTQYGLVNSANQILVSESEAAIFAASKGSLDSYLKQHGLEYTTTYFKELGALENSEYPEPFANISVVDMQKYYEGYASYQNSKEVEDYEKSYKSYILNSSNLMKASEASLESFLTASSNNPLIAEVTNAAGEKTLQMSTISSATTIAEAVNAFKTAFTDTNSTNTYNPNYLVDKGLLSESVKNSIEEIINAYTYPASDPKTGADAVKYTENTKITPPAGQNADGNYEYEVEDGIKVIVDGSGKVIGVDDSGMVSNYGAEGTSCALTYQYPIDGTTSLEQFLSGTSYNLSGTDAEGNVWTEDYYYNAQITQVDGKDVLNLTISMYGSDLSLIKNQLNLVSQEILTTILVSANYENFAELLLNPSFNASSYGIDINKIIPGLDKTLEAVLTDYVDSKNTFLNNIFAPDSLAQVEQHIKDNYSFTVPGDVDEAGNLINYTVTPENLAEVDFVLKYLKAEGLNQSESFNTVIKEYLIDSMIDVYGEPKYAWVDENDIGNTGNADAKAQWYTNLFNRMKQGHKVLENGLASSSQWLAYALENGIVSLEQVDKSFKWNGLSYKTCTRITEETDTEATTKAEAEYNRAMNDIKAKDNIYDMQLKNIDTEHTSLQTEYDVIKSVIDKNISRTFKFNQSA